MDVSAQLHGPAALPPRKERIWMLWSEENVLSCRESNSGWDKLGEIVLKLIYQMMMLPVEFSGGLIFH
jgi:hypothetical protein